MSRSEAPRDDTNSGPPIEDKSDWRGGVCQTAGVLRWQRLLFVRTLRDRLLREEA
jgi:hypothetical protein